MASRDAGQAAEQRALSYLQQQGLHLIAANYRSRFGEIDLILRDGAVLVFAEVRQRSRADYGGARASITAAKQTRLIKTAQHFLVRYRRPPACRFDAVLLGAADDDAIEWIRDAFRVE